MNQITTYVRTEEPCLVFNFSSPFFSPHTILHEISMQLVYKHINVPLLFLNQEGSSKTLSIQPQHPHPHLLRTSLHSKAILREPGTSPRKH